MSDLRIAEAIAGRQYWQTFAQRPDSIRRSLALKGSRALASGRTRTSPLDSKRPRKSGTPAHAALNYISAIAHSEATIAVQRMGFDPTLGLMHTDKRYRPSLASDLMEPV